MKQNNTRQSERGSALVYILIAIALLAALTVSFMEPSSQQTSAQSGFRTVSALKTQADQIRSAIQECVLRYPQGDTTVVVTNPGATDLGANIRYPLKPNSTHLTSPDGNRQVRNIRCPGNNTGTVTDHVDIFASASGKFLPPPPDLFGEWQYYNGTDGVFFWIETANSDAFLTSAMEKLDEQYGECEADLIDATGGVLNLDSGTTVTCPNGSQCFRIWMIMQGTARHADNGAPEACGAGVPT